MDVMIFVLVNLLFVADIIRAKAFLVKPLEIGTLGTISCDHAENDPEIRIVQWFKSKRLDVFKNGDSSLAEWVNGVTDSQTNYQMENNTFSLVIEKATLEDEGLYECSVERGDLYIQSPYYTRMVMYALPRKDPEITLNLTLNRVNCTVEHVKPLIYPEFNVDYSRASTETYAFLNEDGTYTTSVSCALPRTKSASQVDCSFSYLHYQRVASLDLRHSTTDGLIEDKTTTISPMGTSVTFEGDGTIRTIGKTAIIFLVILIILLAVTNVMLIIKMIQLGRKLHQCVRKCNNTKECEEKLFPPKDAVKVLKLEVCQSVNGMVA